MKSVEGRIPKVVPKPAYQFRWIERSGNRHDEETDFPISLRRRRADDRTFVRFMMKVDYTAAPGARQFAIERVGRIRLSLAFRFVKVAKLTCKEPTAVCESIYFGRTMANFVGYCFTRFGSKIRTLYDVRSVFGCRRAIASRIPTSVFPNDIILGMIDFQPSILHGDLKDATKEEYGNEYYRRGE
jgi:hypothetical protein